MRGPSPPHPSAHFHPIKVQVLHLQDLLLDIGHQDLGASGDFRVGQQDPQHWHPGSNRRCFLTPVLPSPPAAPVCSASKGPFQPEPPIRSPISFKKVKQGFKCRLGSGWFLLGKRNNCTSAIKRSVTYLLKSVFFKQDFPFEILSPRLASSSH